MSQCDGQSTQRILFCSTTFFYHTSLNALNGFLILSYPRLKRELHYNKGQTETGGGGEEEGVSNVRVAGHLSFFFSGGDGGGGVGSTSVLASNLMKNSNGVSNVTPPEFPMTFHIQ